MVIGSDKDLYAIVIVAFSLHSQRPDKMIGQFLIPVVLPVRPGNSSMQFSAVVRIRPPVNIDMVFYISKA